MRPGSAGAGDEVLNCTGNENIIRFAQVCDARRNVHSNSMNVVIGEFDFAGVNADSDPDIDASQGFYDGERTRNCARGPLKPRKESITQRFNFYAAEPRKFVARNSVVGAQEIVPRHITRNNCGTRSP